MSDEYRRITLWQVASTDKAYLFATLPKSYPKHRTIWIPRSVISHISRNPTPANEWPQCIVDVADWFAEKQDL